MSDSFSNKPTPGEDQKEDARYEPEEVIEHPIEDFLDLHTFRPQEVKELLHDYLEEAHRRGFREVRIIHGKGTGALRQRVHSVLEKHPLVSSFQQADSDGGSWGATIVLLGNASKDTGEQTR